MGCALKLFNKDEGDEKTQIEKRCLIIGLDGAGKTTILSRMANKAITGIEPTVGLNVEQIPFKNFSVSFWDLGGAATILWKHYYHSTDAFIFVIDSSDHERYQLAKEELHNAAAEPDLVGCPLLIYANKQDKPEAATVEEISKEIDFESLQQTVKVIVPCSAEKNTGITEGLNKIIEVLSKISPPPV